MIKKLKEGDSQIQSFEKDLEHSPFSPLDIRIEDPVRASLISDDNSRFNLHVWKYSPFGLTILKTDDVNLNLGDEVKLIVQIDSYESDYTGIVVSISDSKNQKTLIGIRTFFKSNREQIYKDERESQRWECPVANLPTGTASNPVKFNDYIFFRIEDISYGGFKIITSMRNKLLQRGMHLDATISLPMIGSVTTSFVIRYIDTKTIDNKEYLVAGVKFIETDETFTLSLCEYILNFATNVSVSSLVKDGFKIKNFSKYVDFSYSKTKEEYRKVLDLRYKYLSHNIANDTGNSQCMSDIYDSRSRILIAKFKDEVIGTARIMYHESYEETERAQYMAYPDDMPPISECVEATKFCIDSSSRGVDIFRSIMAHLVLTVVKSGRRYLMVAGEDKMLPTYTKYGFRDTGVIYYRGEKNIKHTFLIMDTYKLALGREISLKNWSAIYGQLANYLIEKEYINVTKVDLMRLGLLKKSAKLMGYL